MGNHDESLGSILIATWVGTILSTHVAREAVHYFKSYPGDKIALKLLVSVALFTGLILQIASYADVYMYTITHWGNEEYLLRQYWPVQVYLTTTAITTLLIQSFLVHRHWNLTQNLWFCVILVVLVVTTFAGNIAAAWVLAIHDSYEERYYVRAPAILWLLTQTLADVTITSALILQLYTMKTVSEEAENIVRRLIRQSIQTGATTALVATSALTIYLLFNMSNIETALTFVLGPLYLVTLLSNVNGRQPARKDDLESRPIHKRISSMSFQHRFSTAHSSMRIANREAAQAALEGIRIHRTSTVYMDTIDGVQNLEKNEPMKRQSQALETVDDQKSVSNTSESCDEVSLSQEPKKEES
ncbi:hypothetical protein VKT23_016337 [Stygiomarasmius scandens]|uniref:DUF6534 domain-containing protein n=1 Tax=Marasmiellus scandens TaxID=2682957 RepID=A0ABR1IVG9_9AGAR